MGQEESGGADNGKQLQVCYASRINSQEEVGNDYDDDVGVECCLSTSKSKSKSESEIRENRKVATFSENKPLMNTLASSNASKSISNGTRGLINKVGEKSLKIIELRKDGLNKSFPRREDCSSHNGQLNYDDFDYNCEQKYSNSVTCDSFKMTQQSPVRRKEVERETNPSDKLTLAAASSSPSSRMVGEEFAIINRDRNSNKALNCDTKDNVNYNGDESYNYSTKVCANEEQQQLNASLEVVEIEEGKDVNVTRVEDEVAEAASSSIQNLKTSSKSLNNNNVNKNDDNNCFNRDKNSKKASSFKQKQQRALKTISNNFNVNCRKLHLSEQLRFLNSIIFSKVKLLFIIMVLFGIDLRLFNYNVEAGFWTFYFPNMLKPSGYKELTDMIKQRELELNSIKDNYADIQYFWALMKEMELTLDTTKTSEMYPEDSVCSELFPMFRELAGDYVEIDYEHYMTPLQDYYDHLVKSRSEWFPDGEKSKNILPREWEQQLYEKDLVLQIEWRERLTNKEEFKEKRKRMVELYNSVKRGLDNSLACVYLKYSYRQVSEDINQLALEMNVNAMKSALEMLRDAYKRIEKFKDSDQKAKEGIASEMKKKIRFEIKSPFRDSKEAHVSSRN